MNKSTPVEDARVAANLHMIAYGMGTDQVEERNAIERLLLKFYDAGQATSLSRVERLEALLRRALLRLNNGDDVRQEIIIALSG